MPYKRRAVQEIGCCLGQDIRQLIVDGWAQNELAAIDLVPDYWCSPLQIYLTAFQIKSIMMPLSGAVLSIMLFKKCSIC